MEHRSMMNNMIINISFLKKISLKNNLFFGNRIHSLLFIIPINIFIYIAFYLFGIIQLVSFLEQVFLLSYLFVTLIYLRNVQLFENILIKYRHSIPILIIMIRIYLLIPTYLSYNLFLLSDLTILFEDNYMLMMNPGNNQGGYGGGFGGSPSGFNSGGSGGPEGPQVLGYTYPAISNSENSNDSEQAIALSASVPVPTPMIASNLAPVVYDPAGTVPPKNSRELYRLMKHRVDYQISSRGVPNVTVMTIFSKDDIINKIAKEMLFAYIFDHKEQLPIAYKALNLPEGPIR
jgi:hypothetical protein